VRIVIATQITLSGNRKNKKRITKNWAIIIEEQLSHQSAANMPKSYRPLDKGEGYSYFGETL